MHESSDKTQEAEQARFARLEALGASLAGTRKEAIDGRKASGIEDIWREDEEHYEGIDELNRGQATTSWNSKPPGQLQPGSVGNTQSTEFVNITRPYVDAAAAKVGDILLPTDERSWGIKETPIPELIEKAGGKLPIEVIEGMAQAQVPEEKAIQVAQLEQENAQRLIAEAKEKAKRAQKRIEDWHVEGQWHAQVREVIDDAARIGTGVLKGPIPARKRQQMFSDGALVIKEETKPISKRVDPWNCFPDPACGRSIHNGRYHWERDYITARQLAELKKDPDYIARQIEICLEEGPAQKKDSRQTADGRTVDDKDLFEIWYFCGYAQREDMEAAGCKCDEGHVLIPAAFTMINEHVIKGALNHLDTGEFPYDYMPWQRRKNSPWGNGVGRQIRTPQRIVAAATRVMLTNAGRAAGPMLVVQNHVRGADGSNDIVPWKVFYAAPSDSTDDARKAVALIEIPALTDQLMVIVQFGLKLAEDVTGLPLLLQGQSGSAPETLGGQQLVDRNASGVLRRIARTFDDCITEPHIRRYYTYLLMYGEEDIEKGEFVIDARGSTALVERDINRQEVTALLEASLNPAFDLDPAKTMAEKLRADNRDPKDFQLTDEQRAARAQQRGDPRAEASKEVAQIRAKTEQDKAMVNAQSDMAELRFKAVEAEKQRQHERQMSNAELQMKVIEFAKDRGIEIGKVKADLAKTVMSLRVQEKVSRQRNASQVAKPAVEPVGRAPNGQAFER